MLALTVNPHTRESSVFSHSRLSFQVVWSPSLQWQAKKQRRQRERERTQGREREMQKAEKRSTPCLVWAHFSTFSPTKISLCGGLTGTIGVLLWKLPCKRILLASRDAAQKGLFGERESKRKKKYIFFWKRIDFWDKEGWPHQPVRDSRESTEQPFSLSFHLIYKKIPRNSINNQFHANYCFF